MKIFKTMTKKKKVIIGVFIFLFLITYLFTVHYFIYRRIGHSGLPVLDIKEEYSVSSDVSKKSVISYTALGDSLTAGMGVSISQDSFPYQLSQKISNESNSVALRYRAYPGAKTEDLIRDLLTSTINDQPNIVTLLIGVNDIHGGISKTEFAKNYAEILRRLKTETKAKIFIISIPYIGTDSLLLPPFNLYFKYQTIEYNKIIKKLAQINNIQYVDLYTPTEFMFKDNALYSIDLFHPSTKGYELWAEIIYADFNK